MSADLEQLRRQFAEALWADGSGSDVPLWTRGERTRRMYLRAASSLLPHAESYAAQKAAEELEAAAEELHVLRFNADANPQTRWPSGSPRVAPDSFYRGIVLARLSLRARACHLRAALSPATEKEKR